MSVIQIAPRLAAGAPDRFRGAYMLVLALGAGAFLGPVPRLSAGEIEFFPAAFLPQQITAERGDTVKFIWRGGAHTVTSGLPDGAPGSPLEPGALFDVVLDEANPEFELVIPLEQIGGIAFFDRNNPAQIGFISIDTGERTLVVQVVDNVFIPEVLHVFAGDTVLWRHDPNEGFHTVTSGKSSDPADNPGALFDEESSDAKPEFAYLFDAPGDYPYFCRPHEHLDMIGVIVVQPRFIRGDVNGDGAVDIADPIRTLNHLFGTAEGVPCDDASDANDDGAVDIGDPIYALNFLFGTGAEFPRPYPLAGADRTEDELVCRE